MRFREFLIEYSRDKTAEMFGDKLITALVQDRNRPAVLAKTQGKAAMGSSWHTPEEKKEWIDTILAQIEIRDPTPNKAYTPWLARIYANGGMVLSGDERPLEILKLYDLAKKRRMLKPEHTDINNFKTYRDLLDTMVKNYDLDEIEAGKPDPGKAKKIYSDDDVTVIVPEDKAGSQRVGRGTEWCTAWTKTDNRFDSYNKQGPLYVLVPKHPKHEGEKYQIHFATEETKNERNRDVSLVNLLINRFPKLYDFFKSQEDIALGNDIRLVDPSKIQTLLDQIKEAAVKYTSEKIANIEQNDEYYYEAMAEKYGDEDGVIDWDSVAYEGDDYLNWNDDLRRMKNAFMDSVNDVTIDDILAYVNSEDYANSLHDLSEIPEIMVFFATNSNSGLRINSMFNEFWDDISIYETQDNNFIVRI